MKSRPKKETSLTESLKEHDRNLNFYHVQPYSEQEYAKRFPDTDADVKKMLGLNYVPLLFRTIATFSPSLVDTTWQMMRSVLCTGNLDRTLKEMMFVAIANARDCKYCAVAHQAMALQYGLDYGINASVVKDLDNIQPDSTREILKFSVALAQGRGSYSDRIDRLIKNGVKQEDISEIIAMISCANYMVSLADGTMTDSDEHFYQIIKKAEEKFNTKFIKI